VAEDEAEIRRLEKRLEQATRSAEANKALLGR
jgi:hypothetical protein